MVVGKLFINLEWRLKDKSIDNYNYFNLLIDTQGKKIQIMATETWNVVSGK